MPFRDIVPPGDTLPAAGCSGMLGNEDRVLPPGSLSSIVPWFSGRKASLDETVSFRHHGVHPLGFELFEFFPLQPEFAPE